MILLSKIVKRKTKGNLPADPVNPETKARRASHGAIYSLYKG